MSATETARWASSPRWQRLAALGAVILVPLAFAGLTVGAITDSDTASNRIPVALVNEDVLIYQTAADGTETPVFAGRQLVTELIEGDSFDWTISNAEDAEQALADGEVYAILSIPANFSESILSLSGDEPQRAMLGIQTNDAHSLLTGALSESVGTGMAEAFGTQITAQYISAITSGLGELGSALGDAADGAGELSTGATQLSSGIDEYTGGVDSLSSGLDSVSRAASRLTALAEGVTDYSGQISQLAGALASVNAQLAANPNDAAACAALAGLTKTLTTAAAGGSALAEQASTGIPGVQGGISQSAAAAAQLSAGSADLRSGAASLLTGASELATGLDRGAELVPETDQREASAQLVADPVGVNVTRDNAVLEPTQALAAFLVPLGLWVGALAIFLVEPRLSSAALASTARSRRLLWATLGRASLISLGQAAVLVALLHVGIGVGWSLLPSSLAFAALTAIAFTAFHHLLTEVFGRAGLVLSLFAIAVQITSTGGLYPLELLSAPFQAISPLLPLTYAVDGMQVIIAGGGAVPVLAAGAALLAFGAVSAMLSLVAIRRRRNASAPWLATAQHGGHG